MSVHRMVRVDVMREQYIYRYIYTAGSYDKPIHVAALLLAIVGSAPIMTSLCDV